MDKKEFITGDFVYHDQQNGKDVLAIVSRFVSPPDSIREIRHIVYVEGDFAGNSYMVDINDLRYAPPLSPRDGYIQADVYQTEALKTANQKGFHSRRMFNFFLGLMGELGEVAEWIKKSEFHEIPQDREKLKKELGDVLWYYVVLVNLLGFRLSEIMEANIEKLAARYPNGFQSGGGNRDESAD